MKLNRKELAELISNLRAETVTVDQLRKNEARWGLKAARARLERQSHPIRQKGSRQCAADSRSDRIEFMNKDKYIVLQERNVEQLQKTINAAMELGYTPIGGVAVHSGQGVWYVQSMLLTESKKPGE